MKPATTQPARAEPTVARTGRAVLSLGIVVELQQAIRRGDLWTARNLATNHPRAVARLSQAEQELLK